MKEVERMRSRLNYHVRISERPLLLLLLTVSTLTVNVSAPFFFYNSNLPVVEQQ